MSLMHCLENRILHFGKMYFLSEVTDEETKINPILLQFQSFDD